MRLTVVLVFSVIAVCGVSFGQPGPGQMRAGERVEQFRKLRMIEVLKLDDKTSVPFFTKYNKHEEIVRDINKQREDLLDDLQRMRESQAKNADLEKVIDKLLALDTKLAEERSRYVEDLKSVLSTGQIADLLLFERNFTRNVRHMMQEMMRERRQGRQ
jgi:hypothetical protein